MDSEKTTTKRDSGKTTTKASPLVIVPLILGPIVTPLLCDAAKVPHRAKVDKSITDPSDGREWTVRVDGDTIVCEKASASGEEMRVRDQYARICQVLAQAENRAGRYRRAFDDTEDNTVEELRAGMRPEIDRLIAEADAAKQRFDQFESDHPECKRSRLLSESVSMLGKAEAHKKTVDVYTKAVVDWDKKWDEAKAAFKPDKKGEAFKDDHIQEMRENAKATLDKAKSDVKACLAEAGRLREEGEALPERTSVRQTIEIKTGEPVTFA